MRTATETGRHNRRINSTTLNTFGLVSGGPLSEVIEIAAS
jgi:hypothetical protein